MYRNAAEDSATAEISRSQVCLLSRIVNPAGVGLDSMLLRAKQIWQWVRHGLKTEDGTVITLDLVIGMLAQAAQELARDLLAAGVPQATAEVSA